MPVRRVLLSLLLTAAAAPGAEVRTLKGETITGEIVSINAKEVVVAKGKEQISTPLAQVLQIDYNPPGKPATDSFLDVELTDGSLLHCAKFAIKGKEVSLTLLAGQEIKLPLAAVSNILTEAHVEKHRKEWNDRLADRKAKKKRRDMLGIRKGDIINPLEGTFGDGDDKGETIEFSIGTGKPRPIPLANVAGLIFERPIDPNAAPVVCRITDSSRDLIQASAVSSSATGISVTTPSGAKIELAPALLCRLDYSGGKLTWLSDLEPTEVVEKRFDYQPIHYKRDRNLYLDPIRMDSVTYPRGLSLHTTTELEYDLKGDYREFKAVVGLDDDLIKGVSGPVVLRIEGDGKLLKEITLDPRGKVHHQDLSVNIKDVQKLRLRASRGDGQPSDFGLHVDLGDAKVSK
jgi:hypothetical protein